jgi:hypothetical protein
MNPFDPHHQPRLPARRRTTTREPAPGKPPPDSLLPELSFAEHTKSMVMLGLGVVSGSLICLGVVTLTGPNSSAMESIVPVLSSTGCAMVVLAAWRFWRTTRYPPRQVDAEADLEIRHLDSGAVLLREPGGSLEGLELAGRDLRGANLRGESLRGACLRGADLRGGFLGYADLRDADLRGAQLAGTYLVTADLRDADLRGADLRGDGIHASLNEGGLLGANLTGARYDRTTRWPRGFDPAQRGCVEVEATAEGSLPLPAELPAATVDVLPRPSGGPAPAA